MKYNILDNRMSNILYNVYYTMMKLLFISYYTILNHIKTPTRIVLLLVFLTLLLVLIV